MTDQERERIRAWIANWKRTGEELDRLKWEELRAMDERESFHIFNKLGMGWVDSWTSPDHGGGLVAQQAIFSKAHATQRRP